ncbi:hypothetical protein [Aquimarina agarilytica]|uniref:hypothetical protein n=1 Tax=Aquimarina agarilytica TaxID=1087449 RepID=UPI00028965DE|nr:hypothetical protein [Aquimarina agarilytica]
MSKKGVLIGVIVLIISVLLFLNRSHVVDWTPTFIETETKPFDTKVFFDQIPKWFSTKPKQLYTTFYEYTEQIDTSNSTQNKLSKYLYMNISDAYPIDKVSFESLLLEVANGSQAFIATNQLPKFIQDSLGIKIDFEEASFTQKDRTLYLEHKNDSLVYLQKLNVRNRYIKDTLHIKSLGFFNTNKCEHRINFAGIPYKKGIFYLHTTPEVFTNYQMLASKNSAYISTVVSYLPKNMQLLFDKNQKIDPELAKGPLRFILSKPPLKWSWYLLLLGLALFLLFNAKRRQRAIPIIEPLKNTTTEFVHTVSTLHYEAEDYNGIIQKTIRFFLETIRTKYHLPTNNLDSNFVKKLAQKSNQPIEDVERLISMLISMKAHTFSSKEPLIKLNKEIEGFYKKS